MSQLILDRTDAPGRPLPQWFMDDIFGELSRPEQRRAAEAYVRALLRSPGRKTLRGMASSTAELHSLRQFVNQSPWDWMPARRALALQTREWLAPQATVIDLTMIQKHGDRIVGVHRRPLPAGGSANCQLALGVFLAAGEWSVPVHWKLYLNRAWGEDPEHRERARVPSDVRHRPLEHLVPQALDDISTSRSDRRLPVVVDLRGAGDPARTATALAARGTGFLLSAGTSIRIPADAIGRPAPGSPGISLSYPIRLGLPGPGTGRYRVLAEWSPARDRPRKLWLTNLDRGPGELLALLRLGGRSRAVLDELADDYGLRDFSGRSYPGWHHHMTLVSAAYALSRLEPGQQRLSA